MLYELSKRTMDILGATMGLLLIAPLTPFIALAIKLESAGPVIINLPRISQNKKIRVYKFRSMLNNAHLLKSQYLHLNERTDGSFFKIRNDPRLTKVGKIIRKFRIDEFPQLINVLKGELSLVGPRPHEEEEIKAYPEQYKHLALAKAGVTGLSQVSGASGLPFLKELELDHSYEKNKSILMDVKIIGKTLAIIFTDPTAV